MMNTKRLFILLPVLFILLGCTSQDDMMTTELKNVTHEVLLFEFTSDTGNDTSRLRYEIKFSNPNTISINGFHKITINADGIVSSTIATDSSPCYFMTPNSDCIISFDTEQSFEIGMVNSIELVSVEYNFEN